MQLGGVDSGRGPVGGQVQFTEQFFDDTDRDHVLDVVDKCVGTTGTTRLKGCLPELDATPALDWIGAAGGVSVQRLSVKGVSGRGGKVTATCCGGRRIVHAPGSQGGFDQGLQAPPATGIDVDADGHASRHGGPALQLADHQ